MLLQDVRIVSFCHFLQGPAAAQYLADMGADVIKVEPIGGAYERHWSGAKVEIGGVGGFFLAANRNKRSIGLDLKNEDGRAAARRLIASADVVMENFRPGVFERLGFGWDALCAIKADIIYASATGYGATGPLADEPGQDLLIQARSGLMAVTGNPARGPTPIAAQRRARSPDRTVGELALGPNGPEPACSPGEPCELVPSGALRRLSDER